MSLSSTFIIPLEFPVSESLAHIWHLHVWIILIFSLLGAISPKQSNVCVSTSLMTGRQQLQFVSTWSSTELGKQQVKISGGLIIFNQTACENICNPWPKFDGRRRLSPIRLYLFLYLLQDRKIFYIPFRKYLFFGISCTFLRCPNRIWWLWHWSERFLV